MPLNQSSLPAAAGPYVETINAAASQYGIDPALLAAVLNQESGFNPYAVSSAGAEGIAQFMPSTAAGMGVNPFDTSSSIYGAAQYLSKLIDKFGSVPLGVAAYNAGPGAVQKAGGIPSIPETQRYVQSVLSTAQTYGATPTWTSSSTSSSSSGAQASSSSGTPGQPAGSGGFWGPLLDAIRSFSIGFAVVTIAVALIAGGFVWMAAQNPDLREVGKAAVHVAEEE